MICLQFLIFSGSLFGRLSAGKMAEESVEISSPVFVLLFIESWMEGSLMRSLLIRVWKSFLLKLFWIHLMFPWGWESALPWFHWYIKHWLDCSSLLHFCLYVFFVVLFICFWSTWVVPPHIFRHHLNKLICSYKNKLITQ